MSAHTPGPWHVDEEGNISLSSGDMIAWTTSPDDMEVFGESPETWANARLIAAAPDLLEAAQLLEAAELDRQYCKECEDEGEPEACRKCFPKFDDARIKRRAAIAKATAHDETGKP